AHRRPRARIRQQATVAVDRARHAPRMPAVRVQPASHQGQRLPGMRIHHRFFAREQDRRMTARRFMLIIAYDGTNFHGWQKQEPPDTEPLRTVQGVLEETVRQVLGQPNIELIGASRTDSGVHAIGQTAAFTATTSIPPEKLPLAISARLPADCQVRAARIVRDDFNPIRDCESKGYRYTIAHSISAANPPPLFDRHIVWYTWHALDAARMHEAAQHLIGEHDFASFAQINHGRESISRTIHGCSVRALPAQRLEIDVSGSGFLYNMA